MFHLYAEGISEEKNKGLIKLPSTCRHQTWPIYELNVYYYIGSNFSEKPRFSLFSSLHVYSSFPNEMFCLRVVIRLMCIYVSISHIDPISIHTQKIISLFINLFSYYYSMHGYTNSQLNLTIIAHFMTNMNTFFGFLIHVLVLLYSNSISISNSIQLMWCNLI